MLKIDKEQLKVMIITSWIVSLISSYWVYTVLKPIDNEDTSPLKAKIDSLDTQYTNLKSEVDRIDIDSFRTEMKINALNRNSAYFTPSSQGFSQIATSVGHLAVSLKNITKYANGYKLSFNIGNPYLVSFSDVILRVSYNREYDDKKESYEEWKKNSKTAERNGITLLPGSWNTSTVVISPATEEETADITLEVITDNISLRP